MLLHEHTMQDVYGETLVELGHANPAIVVLEADLKKASGTIPFQQAFPQRFIDVGVAEANMIGVAAGLASVGKIPFCATFTPFASRRVYDQVTVSVAYARRNVKIIGTMPGVTAGPNGGTHMCFQDLAIMRVMPNLVVLSPSDAYELRAALHWMVAYDGPVYLQLLRTEEPPIFDEEYAFRLGRAVQLAKGTRATLVSTGYMTRFAQEAVAALQLRGITVDHLHYPTIKPFDEDALIASARNTGHVVTVENQSRLGGLGGAVCEVLCASAPTRVTRLGVPDQFGEVATEDYLFAKHRFGVADIIAAVTGALT